MIATLVSNKYLRLKDRLNDEKWWEVPTQEPLRDDIEEEDLDHDSGGGTLRKKAGKW